MLNNYDVNVNELIDKNSENTPTNTTPEKPSYLKPIFKNFPKELTELDQWLVWKAEYDPAKKKFKKRPYSPVNNSPKWKDPANWGTFDQAKKAYEKGGYDGVSFILCSENKIAGIDLDSILNSDKEFSDPDAKNIVESLASYTDISPSGDGIRTFCFADIPKNHRTRGKDKSTFELYTDAKVLTMTGHILNGNQTIENRQSELEKIYDIYFKKDTPKPPAYMPEPTYLSDISDSDLLEKMFNSKNGDKIRALYNGNAGDDHSYADSSLCSHLAFWTGKDVGRMDSLFRSSALYREKWDKKHHSDGRTYGELTIDKAIAKCTEVYTPKETGKSISDNSGKIQNSFWYEEVNSNGKVTLKISLNNLYDLFKNKGICHIRLKKDDKNFILVQITNNIAKEIEKSDMQKMINDFITHLPYQISVNKTKTDLKEVFARGIHSYISDHLNNFYLDIKMPTFISDSKDLSYFFFKNGFVKIDKDSLCLKNYDSLPGVIWQSQIIDHDFKQVLDFNFSFSQFIARVCTDRRTGKLDILRHTALQETIGYLLHNHVTGYNNKAVVFSESSLDDDPHGRTGKGLIMQAIGKLRKKTTIDGKNFSFDSQFSFQNMEIDTRILFFDDVKKFFDFKRLYSAITEGISFEKKNQDRINLSPEQSPKIAISTNYAIQGNSESDKGRRIDMELLCYFSSSYTPENEFGEVFFQDWNNEKWNKFYNFMFHCVQKWLETKSITNYDSDTKDLKRIINETSSDFVEFANDLSLNSELASPDVYADFVKSYQVPEKECNVKKFGIWLKKWCKYCGYELEKLKPKKIDGNTTRLFIIKAECKESEPAKEPPNDKPKNKRPVEIYPSCKHCEYLNGVHCKRHDLVCDTAYDGICKGNNFKDNVN